MALAIKQTRVVEVPVTTLRAAIDMACVARPVVVVTAYEVVA
jgi:hypothetical protein